MRETGPTTFVVGCGVSGPGDDSAGLQVVEALSQFPNLSCEFRVYDRGWPPGFLSEIPVEAMVIFVAAVHSDAAPGTIWCLKLPSKSVQCRHLHSLGDDALSLEDELQLAISAHGASPRTFLLGIEGAHGSGDELSQRARAAVDDIVRNFARYLKLARDMA